MKLSNFFIKTRNDASSVNTCYSHSLMLRAGMINQSASGIYSWLPVGLKVMKKIEKIVRNCHDQGNCIEMLIPTLQPGSVWEKSNRIGSYGKELLKIQDRHEATLVYGPTAEECVTDLFHKYSMSYKDMPCILYNIQWKFRDEIRPKHGVIRGREFLMSDAYSFDETEDMAIRSYERMFGIFVNIFTKIGLPYIAVKADSGEIGGDHSHEFHLFVPDGDNKVFMKKKYQYLMEKCSEFSLKDVNEGGFVSDEKCSGEAMNSEEYISSNSIEVGHNFYFGDKYTSSMDFYVQNKEGKRIHAMMGSYGVGVSRLVAAIIDASHDDKGPLWPVSVAPFNVVILSISNSSKSVNYCNEIYGKIVDMGLDVGYDDRDISLGQKINDAYLIGYSYTAIFGEREIDSNQVKIITRIAGQKSSEEVVEIEGFMNICRGLR
jgi:prolyl-tRNA synthetase